MTDRHHKKCADYRSVTAVTTCKGRRSHLEITLPLMLAEFDKVIVVDFDCPEQSGDYAITEGASVVFERGHQFFSSAIARNAGAEKVITDYIAFIDADHMPMGCGDELRSLLDPDSMVLAGRNEDGTDVNDLVGFIACPTTRFYDVGRYDESWVGWGQEDIHLRVKLLLDAGLKVKRLSGMALGAIAHTNAERNRYREMHINESARIGLLKFNDILSGYGISNWLTNNRTADIAVQFKLGS